MLPKIYEHFSCSSLIWDPPKPYCLHFHLHPMFGSAMKHQTKYLKLTRISVGINAAPFPMFYTVCVIMSHFIVVTHINLLILLYESLRCREKVERKRETWKPNLGWEWNQKLNESYLDQTWNFFWLCPAGTHGTEFNWLSSTVDWNYMHQIGMYVLISRPPPFTAF